MLPLRYTLRNLLREPGKLAQKLAGSTLVLFLILAAGAFNIGMRDLLRGSGSAYNALFLGAGSEESVERSQIPMRSEAMIGAGIPGIATRAGVPAVSGEVHYMGWVGMPDGRRMQGITRGVTPAALEVHRNVRLVEGDWPATGEVMVGSLAHHSLSVDEADLAVGKSLMFEGEEMRIAGHFDAGGGVAESEIWFNRSDLMALIQRETLSCVIVRMEDPAAFGRADLFVKQRLDLELGVERESAYYGNLEVFYRPIRGISWLTAVLVAIGAVLGGLNMLYAAFASRIRELATLQTLGFRRRAILLSLIQESLITQMAGAILATILAFVLLHGQTVRFSMGAFEMQLVPPVFWMVLGTALVLGTVGTLPPALRCLKTPVPIAIRSH